MVRFATVDDYGWIYKLLEEVFPNRHTYYQEGLAEQIQQKTGVKTTTTILGHQQRGGSPTVRDRVAASLFGAKATQLLSQGISGRIVAMRGESVIDLDIEEALSMTKTMDEGLIETGKILSLY